eukprot:gene33668-43513_t
MIDRSDPVINIKIQTMDMEIILKGIIISYNTKTMRFDRSSGSEIIKASNKPCIHKKFANFFTHDCTKAISDKKPCGACNRSCQNSFLSLSDLVCQGTFELKTWVVERLSIGGFARVANIFSSFPAEIDLDSPLVAVDAHHRTDILPRAASGRTTPQHGGLNENIWAALLQPYDYHQSISNIRLSSPQVRLEYCFTASGTSDRKKSVLTFSSHDMQEWSPGASTSITAISMPM